MKILTHTNSKLTSISILILRLTAGAIFFVAGAGKLFGWFEGMGMEATLIAFSDMGFNSLLTYLAVYSELLGGLFLMIGFLTRPSALLTMITMVVATSVIMPYGFFSPGGAAYPFSLAVISLVILLTGPMAYAVDSLFDKK